MTSPNEQEGNSNTTPPKGPLFFPLITLKDWQRYAAQIEEQRDAIGPLIERTGQDPEKDPRYTHLLGKLSLANDQIRGLERQGLEEHFDMPDTSS